MNLRLQAARNIGSNWFGLGVNMLVGLFLSPFILHRLGDDAFGLWILIFSATGYYGLFDMGIRSSIIKYVAKYSATDERERLNRLISTSLFGYSCVAAFLLISTLMVSARVDRVFHVPPNFVHTARLLFLMVGAAVAMGFPLSVFGGVLQGLQQFHWLNFVQVGATLLRAALIVIALSRGGGLLIVALITVALPLLSSVVYVFVTQRLLAPRIAWRFVEWSAFRELVSYGSATFVIVIAENLRFNADAIIIGIFLSQAAIAYFAIGAKLVDYAVNVVDSMADIFTPLASSLDAKGDMTRLRELFIAGNRACALVIFPICVTLVILGKAVITVWVGARYVDKGSYIVLLLLLIPRTLYRAQGASSRILFGMARHRVLALALVIEGAINVGLSVLFVQIWGIFGDALGTTVPLMLTSLFFLPIYLCRLLKVPLFNFLKRAYVVPLALCVPLAGVLLLLRSWFEPRGYPQLILQLALGGSVYLAGLAWLFFRYEPLGMDVRTRLNGYFQRAVSRG